MTAPDYSPLWFWVREREAIRLKRAAGAPKPWTADPTLLDWRFCNVRREDDTVTVWIRHNIRLPYANHELLWLMLCAGRQINLTDTLDELLRRNAFPNRPDWEPAEMTDVLQSRMNRGATTFTGVYTINAPAEKGALKSRHVAETVLGNLWRARDRFIDYFAGSSLKGAPTLQKTHAMLSEYQGWGDFMAYQAVVDMRFTKLLDRAEDLNRWAAAGPGTLKGLNRLHGRSPKAKLSQEQALAEMRAIYRVASAETGVAMDFSDVPNILCEVDKLIRHRNGEGDLRNRYPGRA